MSEPATILIDTHVHLYAGAVGAMLNSAAERFAASAKVFDLKPGYVACLMLTETARDSVFADLVEQGGEHDGWQITGEAKSVSLWASHPKHGKLLVIAGGQTVTAEGIEVLSLGTRQRFTDRMPIDETIEQVLAADALAVLPYGLGKWLGTRGKIVSDAFERWHDKGVRLGDNAGRPSAMPDPQLFAKSKALRHAVLPGSDPLRTGHGKAAAGSYGVVVRVSLDEADPAASIKKALRELPTDAKLFGRRVGLTRCVADQLALRLNKHLGR